MRNTRRRFSSIARGITVVTLSMAAAGVLASPASYTFFQSSWSAGGSVVGSFSGADLNNDGFLDLSSGEVVSYEMSFSGDSVIPAFQHGIADLEFFHYLVGSTTIFSPSYAYSSGAGYIYDPDDHVIATPDLSTGIFSTANVVVVPTVPEPETFALLAIGLAALACTRLRPRRSGHVADGA